ncbi:benzoate-CoA ligase family protein [Desulfovibrio aminophilus]|uniref:benzoate-CoA ligase family protein n=1 Tax=Desulfovibrio aminophilus TaxID=81425 RepID=UPI0004045F8C|nr:benzoate-CoA ligase family protein [Desulfovibrio aminophilus]
MTHDGNAAAALLARNLEVRPDKTAYVFGAKEPSYRSLARDAARMAHLLTTRGVVPGDRVALALEDSPAFVTAFLGTILAGGVATAMNTTLTAEEYVPILEDCGARLVCADPEHPAASAAGDRLIPCARTGPDLAGLPDSFQAVPRAADDLAFMLFSSGSTGRPKGVPHRQGDCFVPAETWGRPILGLDENSRIFSASKLYFAYGLESSLLINLSVGATALLFPDKPGPYELFEAIGSFRPTHFFCVPTLYNLMLRALEPGMDLSSLKVCFSAGEALPAALFEEWRRAAGLDLVDGIGSTEACNVFLSNRPGSARPGTSGLPVPGYEARIVDQDGRDLPPGQAGDLLVRGPGIAPYYWNRPDKTRETMLPDGWLHTGDVYVRDADGYYSHQGRSDDMIKAGAHWVAPMRVEDALRRHPAVHECAVAACKVEGLDRPCAFVVPVAGTEPGPALVRELRAHAAKLLPGYMCPVRVEFRRDLPKTPTGKIQRFRLRAEAAGKTN